MSTKSQQIESPPTVQSLTLEVLENQPNGASLSPGMAALAKVKTRVTVVAGHADATVGEIMALKAGSVMALEQDVNSPFDLVLNGAVIARGQLVAIGNRFGICITEVSKTA